MIARILPVLAILTAVSVGSAQSQPPPPSNPETGREVEGSSQREQQDRDDAEPSARVVLGDQPTTDQSSSEQNTEPSEDWRIVLFTFILTVVAVLQLIAMAFQSHYMRRGLDEAKKSADAAALQAAFARQQLIGTLGAILNCEVTQSDIGILVQFTNFGGVDARRVSGEVQIARVALPSIEPVAPPIVYPFAYPVVPHKNARRVGKLYAFPPEWWPPRQWTNWHDSNTVSVEVRFAWDNGFGEKFAESHHVVYLPIWEYRVGTSGTRGGGPGFQGADCIADLWRDISNQLRLQRNTQDPPGWGKQS